LAVSIALCPRHRSVSTEVTKRVLAELTVKVIESTAEHNVVLSVTVTKYFVTPPVKLEIVGLEAVVLLRPVAGDHEYV
jgi:hypothetical protein